WHWRSIARLRKSGRVRRNERPGTCALSSADNQKATAKNAAPLGARWAITTFVALFALNMLDYLDRNLLVSMQPQIKSDLGITNFRWGMLTSIFLVSYSIFGPVMGWLGDRFRRTW